MSAPATFLSELGIRQFMTVAGHTLLVYDYLLTFNVEMDYIWRAPLSTVKVVFLLNRYGTLIGQSFLTLEELGLLSNGSRKFCAHVQWFQSLFVLCSSEATRTLLLLRAWALWRCSYRIAISLVCVYVFFVMALGGYASYIIFTHDSYFKYPYLDETWVCVVYVTVRGAWLLGLISFFLDSVLFAVIAYYIYRLCKGPNHFQSSPLLRLLVRDAIIFYMVNVFHDVLTALTLSVFVKDPRNLAQITFSFPLLTVVGQRVVLNLRGFQSAPYATQDLSRLVDRRIAAMQHRSFWQSIDVWMNDIHQELERGDRTTTRTIGSHVTDEEGPYELRVVQSIPAGSRRMSVTSTGGLYDPFAKC